jgi:hypothetical protein
MLVGINFLLYSFLEYILDGPVPKVALLKSIKDFLYLQTAYLDRFLAIQFNEITITLVFISRYFNITLNVVSTADTFMAKMTYSVLTPLIHIYYFSSKCSSINIGYRSYNT